MPYGIMLSLVNEKPPDFKSFALRNLMNTQVHPTATLAISQQFEFNFKTNKAGYKRPSIKVDIEVPTVHGIADIINSGNVKQIELLLAAVADTVRSQAVSLIADDETVTADNFPHAKCTWEFISALTKAERETSKVSDEQLNSFLETYLEVMTRIGARNRTQLTNAAAIMAKRLTLVKFNKDALGKLQAQLSIFAEQQEAEQHVEALSFLLKRIDTYLKLDDAKELASNL
jgi:hypothetical protein